MDERSNPCVPWIGEYSGEIYYQKAVGVGSGALPVCSPKLLLNVDKITATIEDIGSITSITVGEIQGVGRDLGEVRYAGKRIFGYGDLIVLKYSNNAVDYR